MWIDAAAHLDSHNAILLSKLQLLLFFKFIILIVAL